MVVELVAILALAGAAVCWVVLVVPELRKPAEGGGPTFPVFVLERFDTFDAADLSARMAKGREIVLYRGTERPPHNGCQVHLTIDLHLQTIVEDELDPLRGAPRVPRSTP